MPRVLLGRSMKFRWETSARGARGEGERERERESIKIEWLP